MGFEMQPRPGEPPSAKLPRPVESSEKAHLDISCLDRQMNLRMTVEVLLYWVVGAAYLHLGPEEFTITNAMYYITVTITTVGYGDITVKTTAGKVFTMVWIVLGLVVIFPILAEVGDRVLRLLERLAGRSTSRIPSVRTRGVLGVSLMLSPFLAGSLFFVAFEFRGESDKGEWRLIDCFYFSLVTVTSVGYGDLSFTHGDTCRRFLVVFILSSVVLVTAGIKSLINISSELHAEAKEHRLLDSFDFELLKSMAMEGRHVGGVAKTDYILTMLRLMELVDEEKVALYGNMFDSYDKDGSGVLDDADVALMEAEHTARVETAKRLSSNYCHHNFERPTGAASPPNREPVERAIDLSAVWANEQDQEGVAPDDGADAGCFISCADVACNNDGAEDARLVKLS